MARLTKSQMHQIQQIAKIMHKQDPHLPYSKCVQMAYWDWKDNHDKYHKK